MRSLSRFNNFYQQDKLVNQNYLAALDLGSNTCRILIAKPQEEGYKIVDSFSRVIRLGTGVRSSGYLSQDAMSRAIEALKECSKKIEKYQILNLRCVATEACRQAKNRFEFIDRVRRETGIELEIISEEEEARLALKGCNPLINPNIPYVIAFDIGGCSTEVMWAKVSKHSPEVIDWMSIPYGVVSILDACGGDPAAFYDTIREKITDEVSALANNQEIRSAIADNKAQLIGSSGTTTTVAAIHLNLKYYDRTKVDGATIPVSKIHDIANILRSYTPRERSEHACIGPGRSDLVLGGLAILESICDAWALETVCVADRGVRDGILADMLARPFLFDQKSNSVA